MAPPSADIEYRGAAGIPMAKLLAMAVASAIMSMAVVVASIGERDGEAIGQELGLCRKKGEDQAVKSLISLKVPQKKFEKVFLGREGYES